MIEKSVTLIGDGPREAILVEATEVSTLRSHRADPTVRRNRIHDGKQAGIFVYENGRGTFEDNDVFANGGAEGSGAGRR